MRSCWNLALTFSVAVHVALITRLPTDSLSVKKTKSSKKQTEKEVTMSSREIKAKTKIKSGAVSAITPKPYTENIMEALIEDTIFDNIDKANFFKKTTNRIILSEIPPHDRELKKNPAYMNYYRIIREKIRSNAYRNYQSSESGKVLLSFIVLKDGDLGEFFLEEEEITSRILRQITLDSIKAAAPFPPFPEELGTYTQLSFRIPIYFKNE